MPPQRRLPAALLIVLAILAIAGGVATAVMTSPRSFDLSRLVLFEASITPANTPAPSDTETATLAPPTGTPSPTHSVVLPIYLPTSTETIPAIPATDTPGPSPSASATNFPLPQDVWALARVTDLVGKSLVRVHSVPNGGSLVVAIPAGTVVQVLFGQAVVEGVTWRLVRLGSGSTGWVAEYLLVITIHRPAGTGTLEVLGTPVVALPTATPAPNNPPPPGTAAPPASPTAPPAPTNNQITVAPPSATLAPTPTPTIAVIIIATNTSAPATASRTNTPLPAPPSNTPQPTATIAPPTATDTPVPSDTLAPPTAEATPTDLPTPSAIP